MSAGPIQGGRITARNLTIRLGAGTAAFEAITGVDVEIKPGAFVCLLGPSGCGKSTLAGALAGHLRPSAGEILVDQAPVDGPHPDRGLVFQQHTLFPWLTVLDNVAFGLKMRGQSKAQRTAEASAMLELVGLGEFADFHPAELSGGMQQRAEIARVLVNRPRVLLMDEPFGALDAQSRGQMQRQLLDTWTRVRTTVLFITHDIDEALFLGDRVLVMSPRPGRIVADLSIDFPRPRSAELLTTPDFAALKRRCLDLLADQKAEPLRRLSPLGAP